MTKSRSSNASHWEALGPFTRLRRYHLSSGCSAPPLGELRRPSHEVNDPDPEATAECEAHQAWYGHLLEEKVPRAMWQAYAEACEGLATALAASFVSALATVRHDADAQAAAEAPLSPNRPSDRAGFRP